MQRCLKSYNIDANTFQDPSCQVFADFEVESPYKGTSKKINYASFIHQAGDEQWLCGKKCEQKGRRSFISGHSANCWAAFLFLALYLWGKLRAFNPSKRNQSWRLIPGFLLILFPLYVMISRTSDYRHHMEDVVVGSFVGILISTI